MKTSKNLFTTLDIGSHSNAEDNLLVWSAADYQSGSS
jgi:hypothetical protein